MNEEIPYDQIEAYINGTLDEQELVAFERQLQVDAALQEEVAFYRQVRDVAKDRDFNAFEKQLQQSSDAYFNNKKGKRSSPKVIWMIAALVLIILLFFLARQYFAKPLPVEPERIYAEYAQHDFSLQEMGTDATIGAIQARLNNQNYSEALPLIDEYLSIHPDAADVLLAKGVCMLELDRLAEAEIVFTNLQQQFPLYQNESHWYMALLFLKQGQLNKSASVLREIPETSSRYPEALSLLQKITQ